MVHANKLIEKYLRLKVPVVLHYNNLMGPWYWDITPANEDYGLTLAQFLNEQSAREFCKKHKLEIMAVNKDTNEDYICV